MQNDKIMNTVTKYWWLALVKGILLIVLAFMVFRHPVSALVGVAIYIGITLLLTGITEIFASTASKGVEPRWGWGLASGILDLLFGFILLSNPGLSAATLPFVVGFWIIIYGVMTFVDSFTQKKTGNSNWWLSTLYGLLSVIIGFFITNNVMAGILTITWWMGFGFLLAGIIYISVGLRLKPKN